MNKADLHSASFRDPAGFLFRQNGILYRQVNTLYQPHYDQLLQSGLANALFKEGLLIPHEEVDLSLAAAPGAYKILKPQELPFISYPYEWSFDMLRDAALLTLTLMRKAMEHNMILKDATAFNIQFHEGKPLLIDTLSFEKYDETQPWVAYRQFCENFLYPLYLEHYLGTECISWLRQYINGIPGALTAKLLPGRARWNLGVRLHVLLQQSVSKQQQQAAKPILFSRAKMRNLLQHLTSIIENLKPGYPATTTWSNYYEGTILGPEYLKAKDVLMQELLGTRNKLQVLDLGANDGYFSLLAAAKGNTVIAADFDAQCINNLYLKLKKAPQPVQPLVLDLVNPSPALGFGNTERDAFTSRVKPDLVLALALIHHLVIGKNISLPRLAAFFAGIAPELIIEFVPKSDEKVKGMLSGRQDIFSDYTREGFEAAFAPYFTIQAVRQVTGTDRILYLLKRN